MATENKGDQSTSESQQTTGDTQQVELEGSDITGAEGPAESRTDDYQPLFDEESRFSQDELTGEDSETASTDEDKSATTSESKDEKTEEKKQTGDEKKTEETDKDEKKVEVKDEEKKSEKAGEKKEDDKSEDKTDDKPPPGFVPQAALTEERTARKQAVSDARMLRAENDMLRQENAELRTSGLNKKEGDDFKVLTDEEYDELAEEDPSEAAKYLHRLEKHKESLRAEKETDRQISISVQESYQKVEEAVPGLYKNPDLINEIVGFAVEKNDFNERYFEIMTNPETIVIVPTENGERRIPLGDGAASLISLVHSYSKFSKDNDPKGLRESIEAELRPQIEKEIAAKLTKKFKNKGIDTDSDEFRQVGDITPTDSEVMGDEFGGGMVSDAELMKMSPEKRRAYLGG